MALIVLVAKLGVKMILCLIMRVYWFLEMHVKHGVYDFQTTQKKKCVYVHMYTEREQNVNNW